MGSHMPDQNTFLLIPRIQSALKLKTSKKCPENGEPKETDLSIRSIECFLKFKRFFCSASKVPDELMKEIIEKCRQDPANTDFLAENVINCEMVVSHKIRYQFQVNVIKTLISGLEKAEILVPDSIFDRLGVLMGMKEEDYVERLYLTSSGDEILSQFSESVNQLSMGTTGLSVWQASCDLSNLFQLIPTNDYERVIELGSGCGVSGISVAKMSGCEVVLTDYDDNVLQLLKENAIKNDLISEENPSTNQAKVRCLDWCDFEYCDWKEPFDIIIAADVVYDTALLASLCNVLHLLLRQAKAAIVACTKRNEASIGCFEHHLKCAKLEIVEKFEYEDGVFRFPDSSTSLFPSSFPFFSTLKTPTIFYNIQPKKENKLV